MQTVTTIGLDIASPILPDYMVLMLPATGSSAVS